MGKKTKSLIECLLTWRNEFLGQAQAGDVEQALIARLIDTVDSHPLSNDKIPLSELTFTTVMNMVLDEWEYPHLFKTLLMRYKVNPFEADSEGLTPIHSLLVKLQDVDDPIQPFYLALLDQIFLRAIGAEVPSMLSLTHIRAIFWLLLEKSERFTDPQGALIAALSMSQISLTEVLDSSFAQCKRDDNPFPFRQRERYLPEPYQTLFSALMRTDFACVVLDYIAEIDSSYFDRYQDTRSVVHVLASNKHGEAVFLHYLSLMKEHAGEFQEYVLAALTSKDVSYNTWIRLVIYHRWHKVLAELSGGDFPPYIKKHIAEQCLIANTGNRTALHAAMYRGCFVQVAEIRPSLLRLGGGVPVLTLCGSDHLSVSTKTRDQVITALFADCANYLVNQFEGLVSKVPELDELAISLRLQEVLDAYANSAGIIGEFFDTLVQCANPHIRERLQFIASALLRAIVIEGADIADMYAVVENTLRFTQPVTQPFNEHQYTQQEQKEIAFKRVFEEGMIGYFAICKAVRDGRLEEAGFEDKIKDVFTIASPMLAGLISDKSILNGAGASLFNLGVTAAHDYFKEKRRKKAAKFVRAFQFSEDMIDREFLDGLSQLLLVIFRDQISQLSISLNSDGQRIKPQKDDGVVVLAMVFASKIHDHILSGKDIKENDLTWSGWFSDAVNGVKRLFNREFSTSLNKRLPIVQRCLRSILHPGGSSLGGERTLQRDGDILGQGSQWVVNELIYHCGVKVPKTTGGFQYYRLLNSSGDASADYGFRLGGSVYMHDVSILESDSEYVRCDQTDNPFLALPWNQVATTESSSSISRQPTVWGERGVAGIMQGTQDMITHFASLPYAEQKRLLQAMTQLHRSNVTQFASP